MAKDFKLMGDAYMLVREAAAAAPSAPGFMNKVGSAVMDAIGANNPNRFNSAAIQGAAPVTTAGVTGAVSDTSSSDQAKVTFDTAATAYFKAMGIDDANIKKFLDSTHAQLNGFKGKGGANIGGATEQPARPSATGTSPASTQFATGRGLTPSQRPSWASR